MPWMGVAAGVLGGALLGGGGDALSGSKSSSETTPTVTMSPEQQALLKKLLAELSGGGPLTEKSTATPYTGSFAAPLSSLQNTSLAALEQAAMNQVSGGDPTIKAAAKAVQDATSGEPVDINSYFDASVANPTIKQFQDRIIPDLTKRFSGNAAWGSDRMLAERQATEDLGKTLASSRSTMSYQALSDAKNRALTAASFAPAIAGAPTDILTKTLTAGAVPQQTVQTDLAGQYAEFVRQQQGKTEKMNQILSALGLKPFENITTVTPGQPGFLQGAASGVGSALTSYFLKK